MIFQKGIGRLRNHGFLSDRPVKPQGAGGEEGDRNEIDLSVSMFCRRLSVARC